MGFWVVLRPMGEIRDFEKLFKEKLKAEEYAERNMSTIQYALVEGDYVFPNQVFVASAYDRKSDLMDYVGLFSTYDLAVSRAKNRTGAEKVYALGVIPE